MKKYITNLSKILLISTIIFLGVSLQGCGDLPNKSTTPTAAKKPLTGHMYEVTKDNEKAYLVGTIHLYKDGYSYANDYLEKIVNESDGVAVELDITSEEEIAIAQEYIDKQDLQSKLTEVLTTEELERFKDICNTMGMSYDTLKDLPAVQAISKISSKPLIDSGLIGLSYDYYLINRFKNLNKDIVSIESAEMQMRWSESPEEVNNNAISEFVNTFDKSSFDKSIELSNSMFDGLIDGGTYFQDLLAEAEANGGGMSSVDIERNINMTNKAVELLKSGKIYCISVGSLHYYGKDGIIKQLENQGYTVTQLK